MAVINKILIFISVLSDYSSKVFVKASVESCHFPFSITYTSVTIKGNRTALLQPPNSNVSGCKLLPFLPQISPGHRVSRLSYTKCHPCEWFPTPAACPNSHPCGQIASSHGTAPLTFPHFLRHPVPLAFGQIDDLLFLCSKCLPVFLGICSDCKSQKHKYHNGY